MSPFHLFEDNHADAMAALGTVENRVRAENLIQLHGLQICPKGQNVGHATV